MEHSIFFVRITPENIGVAFTIAKTIFPYEVRDDVFLPEEEYELSLKKKYNKWTYFYIVYTNDNIPVGVTGFYYHLKRPNDTQLWLAYFGVLPEFRFKGFGKAILERTLALMKKSNKELSMIKILTCARPEELASIPLYTSFGFTRYQVRKDALGVEWHYYQLPVLVDALAPVH